jgi:hypothetical protein
MLEAIRAKEGELQYMEKFKRALNEEVTWFKQQLLVDEDEEELFELFQVLGAVAELEDEEEIKAFLAGGVVEVQTGRKKKVVADLAEVLTAVLMTQPVTSKWGARFHEKAGESGGVEV